MNNGIVEFTNGARITYHMLGRKRGYMRYKVIRYKGLKKTKEVELTKTQLKKVIKDERDLAKLMFKLRKERKS